MRFGRTDDAKDGKRVRGGGWQGGSSKRRQSAQSPRHRRAHHRSDDRLDPQCGLQQHIGQGRSRSCRGESSPSPPLFRQQARTYRNRPFPSRPDTNADAHVPPTLRHGPTGLRASLKDRDRSRNYVRLALCTATDTNPGFDQAAGHDLLERLRTIGERSVSLDGMAPFDPGIVAAAITALTLGWQMSEEWLKRTFDLADIEERTLVDQLSRLCACMSELALPTRASSDYPSPD